MKRRLLAFAFAVPVALAALPAVAANLVETAAATGRFDRLLSAADRAGLSETLAGPGPYTVFAPTDEAFDTVPYETYMALMQPQNRSVLAEVLRYHVVPGKFTSNDLAGRQTFLRTAQGQSILVVGTPADASLIDERDTAVYNARQMSGPVVGIGKGKSKSPDLAADNGVIIPIDRVLLPQ
jgi:uncharacterized surface protein with fasciclin (FAS1) repeats